MFPQKMRRYPPRRGPQGGIEAEALGVVVALMVGQPAVDRLAEQGQLELAVESDAQVALLTVTHRVARPFRPEVVGSAGFSREKAQPPCRNGRAIWAIRDYSEYPLR